MAGILQKMSSNKKNKNIKRAWRKLRTEISEGQISSFYYVDNNSEAFYDGISSIPSPCRQCKELVKEHLAMKCEVYEEWFQIKYQNMTKAN